jgi:hypothetical protein
MVRTGLLVGNILINIGPPKMIEVAFNLGPYDVSVFNEMFIVRTNRNVVRQYHPVADPNAEQMVPEFPSSTPDDTLPPHQDQQCPNLDPGRKYEF